MKKPVSLSFIALLLTAIIITGCRNGKFFGGGDDDTMKFESYDKQETASTDDGSLTFNFQLGIPSGGEFSDNVIKGISEIIKASSLPKTLGRASGKTLSEIVDNYASSFKERVAAKTLQQDVALIIKPVYQNDACVVLYVSDSGEEFLNSMKYEAVIRLSDGHLMTLTEMTTASLDKLMALARQHADATQTGVEIDQEGKHSVSICEDGLFFHPNQYLITDYLIPTDAIDPYLTNEARALLSAKAVTVYTPSRKYPAKGDLPLFDLYGPVKSLEIPGEYFNETYTFDTDGHVVTMNGEPYIGPLYKKVNRDAEGRTIERIIDPSLKAIETFTYDDEGRVKEKIYKVGKWVENITLYHYNPHGVLTKENSMATVHGDTHVSLTEKYYDYQFDSHGNWTERSNYLTVGYNHNKRIITYYEAGEADNGATATVEQTPAANVVADEVKGELGIFELRGPVKSCVWKGQYSTRRLEFDANGMWTKIDGRKPWADQPNVKRDSQGRMVKTDNGDESTEYSYDAQGRITRCIVQYMDGCDDTRWTYDDNGDCVKNVNSYTGMDAEEGDDNRVSTYTILERDDHGNWTSRKDQNGNKETRTITYYE